MRPDDKTTARLDGKFRRAVLAIFMGRCFFCGAKYTEQTVDVHHYIHRSNDLLRWYVHNGIPACRNTHDKNRHKYNGMSCHQYADTPEGKLGIEQRLPAQFLKYMAKKSLKDLLVSEGMTRESFIENSEYELDNIISKLKRFL